MNFTKIRNKAYDREQFIIEKAAFEKDLIVKQEAYEITGQVQAMLQETVNEIQNTLKYFINDINQQALDIVFPGFSFEMEFTVKNNVSHAGIYIVNNGKRQKPMDANGGGLGNIIALCSQMAAKKMSLTRDVIVADQPMEHLSKGNKEDLAMEMLQTITKDMGIQYIMVSHAVSQINAADKTIEIKIAQDDDLGYPVSEVI